MSRIDADQIPDCDCGGKWGCYECGSPLRRKYAPTIITNVWGTPDVRQYLEAIRDRAAYTPTFPTGDRGGALLDLGDGNRIEVFLPWQDEKTGDVLPYLPMPLDGRTIIHDPARNRAPRPSEIEVCRAGMCRCEDTATGWKLTRPLIRGLLGVSEAFLAEHGRDTCRACRRAGASASQRRCSCARSSSTTPSASRPARPHARRGRRARRRGSAGRHARKGAGRRAHGGSNRTTLQVPKRPVILTGRFSLSCEWRQGVQEGVQFRRGRDLRTPPDDPGWAILPLDSPRS